MTLKELSIELGKPAHVLANTLRQVGLADRLLSEYEELNSAQILRLRKPKTPQAAKQDTETNTVPLTIEALAAKHGRGTADMVNIVKTSRLMPDVALTGTTILPKEIWERLDTRLSDTRIRLRALAKELGIDTAKLANAAYKTGLVDSLNWNQKLDKEAEDKIRKALDKSEPIVKEPEEDEELRELRKYLDTLDNPSTEPVQDEDNVTADAIEANDSPDGFEHPDFNEVRDDNNTENQEESNDESVASTYSVSTVANKLGIAEGRVINILGNVFDYKDQIEPDTSVPDEIADFIFEFYDMYTCNTQTQSFANAYLRDKEKAWDNPVVEKNLSNYAPGSILEGVVCQIDHTEKLIKVQFEEQAHEEWGFWSNKRVVDRPAKEGTVSFDEWDWELDSSFSDLPKAGSRHSFLILRHDDGEDLRLSRRQAIEPMKPQDGEGQIVSHNVDNQLVFVRHSNGSYGFVAYKDLTPFDIEDGEKVSLKLVKKFKKVLGNKSYFFAQYGINDDKSYGRLSYCLDMLGLDKMQDFKMDSNLCVKSFEDFISDYKSGALIAGQITEANAGGYLLYTLGKQTYELFCPYSKSPTWIDKSISRKMIGAKWLVKIESEPTDDKNNTVVSAKLESKDYEGYLRVGSYYSALVCSCNENGANILVEKSVPMFVPNKHIGWKRDNDAKRDLTPGDIVIVKISQNDKGAFASIRDARIAPWLRVRSVYPVGTVVETDITQKGENYVFIDLGEYTGYLPAFEISWTEYIHDCRDYNFPNPLRAVVTGYNDKTKTIQLSAKRLSPDPWTELDKHLPEEKIVTAEITEITNFSAKLKVGDLGFCGYLSFRDVDWCRYIDKNSFPHVVGDRIQVKITHINKDRRILICSLKALSPNPWEELSGKERVEGTVIKVNDDHAIVRIAGDIECKCREVLDHNLEGQILIFDILQLNVAAQQIVISYRKQEIVQLNTLAVDKMFKKYRNLDETDKGLVEETGNEDAPEVYRKFTIKEVGSTGRVTAVYAAADGEYENGILLPGSVVINGYPVNVIFARQIIKQYMVPGETLEFRVTHRYEGFNYAVLAIDAATLLDLNNIATDDLRLLTSVNGVEATVQRGICTNRNIFVQYKGYFGYIPRMESAEICNEFPDTIRVKAVIAPEHPGQMIRFTAIDQEEQTQELQELQDEKELVDALDRDLYDCYFEINSIGGFNPKFPDYYPFDLQIRYDPEQQEELAKLLASYPTYFSSRTFFLDCFKAGKGYVLSLFNNNISISAFCSEKEDGDEIRIRKFTYGVVDAHERDKHYGKPLRIAGENVQIVPLNSSALPPAQQDADIVLAFIKYNREVLPELKRLSRDGLQKRGEHYLTLQELLKIDFNREDSLCSKEVKIKSSMKEVAGSLGGCGIAFDAPPEAFESIMSKDDSDEGIRVMIKPDDNEPFKDCKASGVLKYLGSYRWIVELYANRDIDITAINRLGLNIKRFPNIRYLEKQITAIDNFVYERNGLDIFSKIARNKLAPIEIPPIESIEANDRFNLQDTGDSQAAALKMALGGSQISLIQGPPGTGKSTVIVDIIRNLVKRHKKVLVCTQSVAPVEELYFKLSGRKDGKLVNEPVKIDGRPLRCAYLRDDKSIEISGSVAERRNALRDMMRLVKKLRDLNTSANAEDLENLEKIKDSLGIHHKEECGEVTRKFAKDIMPQYSEVMSILSEYHNALDKEDVEKFASEHRTLNLEAIDVMFGTCIGVAVSPLIRDLHFDSLIIDEAGKANYAESLVPMMMADEYVLVGDDKQLPPYTNSELVKELASRRLNNTESDPEEEEEEADSQLLDSAIKDIMEDVGKSLFGDLRTRLPESNQIMLSKQFRMHPAIGDFVSKLFYDGKVDSAPRPTDRMLNIPGLENPIKFIDTSGMGAEARERRQGMSLYNDGEIQVIEEKLLFMLESAIESGKSVGILSPYGAQVIRMRERFPKLRKHIFTIDSIQGEEYDIVVFSFVRNTRSGSLNFVDDLRRLNVSFSRAKCNLIMVGHLDTLRNESLHKVDKEAVMAVYDEIANKKIELVVHHGAMQRLYDDLPPASCPLIEDLDRPYHVFEDCRSAKNGQFSGSYKGKWLTLYNPVLKAIPKDAQPERFQAKLIGYVDGKPHTMIEPLGLWLFKQNTLTDFRFSAVVKGSEQSRLTLELVDHSLISLSVPNPRRFTEDMSVEVKVRYNRKFTVKAIDND